MAHIGRRRWSSALSLVLVFSMLFLIGTSKPAKTAGTRNPLPAPAIKLNGTVDFTDSAGGFQVHYPAGWHSAPLNPGLELDDDEQNPTSIVQILLPADNQDPTRNWLDYELAQLRQRSGATNFQQVGGITTMMIGGERWTGSAASFWLATDFITVQVFATIHHDQPYIINLFATNVPIAQQSWFHTIIQSFVFLA